MDKCKKCKSDYCRCVRTTDPALFPHAPGIDKTARFPLRVWKEGDVIGNYYLSFQDIALNVNNTPIGYVPALSGNTTDLNSYVTDPNGGNWLIDIEGDAKRVGSVFRVRAGDALPLFSVTVSNSLDDPYITFNLPLINQYQVFGRSASGAGLPSWVTLDDVAFTGDYNSLVNKPAQLWKVQADTKIVPVLYSRIISTNTEDSGYGSIALIPSGTPADPGILGFYNSGGSTIGYIGGVGTRMNYHSSTGNHYFNNAPVQIQTMPVNESAPYMVVTDSSHVLQLKDINSISLWKYEPVSGNLVPKNIFATIATNREDSGYGGVRMMPGSSGLTGRIEFFRYDNTRTGFIGYDYTDIWYLSDLGKHIFKNGTVQVETIPNDNTLTRVWVSDSAGNLKWRDYSTFGSGYTLPIATASVLGGIKVGAGLSIDPVTGVLSTVNSGTDSQTLSWSSATGDLTILNGNTVNLDGRYSLINHTHALDDLIDVTITSPANNQLLKYDTVSAKWINWTPNYSTFSGDYNDLINKPTIPIQYWKTQPDGKLVPLLFNRIISTNVQDSGYGSVALLPGGTSLTGRVEFYRSNGTTRTGFIGYDNTDIWYLAELGKHIFKTGTLQVDNIPNDNTITRIWGGDSAGNLKWIDISSFGGGGNPVWKVQGSSTDATSNTQPIYHNGQLAVGNFSGSTSSYNFHVIGTSFFSGTISSNNSVAFQSYNAGATAFLEVFKTNTSNQFLYANGHLKIDQLTSGNIWIDQYPNTRLDSYVTAFPNRLLYTDATGKLLITDKTGFYNDHIANANTNTQYHTADSTWRKITTAAGTSLFSSAFNTGFSYNVSNYDLIVPANYPGWVKFEIQFQWQTSSGSNGQPVFDVELRRNGSAVGFLPQWSEDVQIKKSTFSHWWRIAGTNVDDTYTVHIRVASGSASMELTKCEFMMTNLGKPNV